MTEDDATRERRLRAAVDAGGGLAARQALAHHLLARERADESDAVLAAAADGATGEELARAVAVRALNRYFGHPRSTSVEPMLTAAEDSLGIDPHPACDAVRGTIALCEGDVVSGLALTEPVVGDEQASGTALTVGSWVVGFARALSGRSDRLAELVDRGVAAAERATELAVVRPDLVFAEILDADLRGRPDLAHRRLDWAAAELARSDETRIALFHGRMAMGVGRPRAAIAALGLTGPAPTRVRGSWFLLMLAMASQCHGYLGEATAARESLGRAEALFDARSEFIGYELDLARAWIAAADGDTAAAVGHCRAGAERCRTSAAHAAEVLLRQTSVRFGDRDQLPPLTELDRMLDSPRANLAAAHAAAIASYDEDRLLVVADALAEAGMCLEAADAAAQAVDFARDRRRPVVEAAAAERVRALAASSEDARTPALVSMSRAADAARP